MAKRRYGKKRRSAKAKPSVMAMIPVGVLGMTAYDGFKKQGAIGVPTNIVRMTTGYELSDGSWHLESALPFYGICLGTYVGKKILNRIGAGRAMAGLPIRL